MITFLLATVATNLVAATVVTQQVTMGSLLVTLGSYATAAAAIFFFVKHYIVRPVKKWKKEWDNFSSNITSITSKVDTLYSDFDALKAEFKPNHGSSLRDAIDRIDRRLHFLDQQTRVLLADDTRPIFISDSKGEYIWCNKAYLHLTGRTMEDVLGYGWKNCIPNNERANVIAEWQAALSEKRDFRLRYSFERPNGELVAIECQANTIHIHQNDLLLGHVGTLRLQDKGPEYYH